MNAIRKEILEYIENISDSKLEALKPVLAILADESIIVDTDLTEEEKAMIAQGREDYKKGDFISLDSVS